MVRRIAPLLTAFIVFSGFTPPRLPPQSQGVYHFEHYSGALTKTLDGAIFSLAVGFRKSALAGHEARPHRERAEKLVERLSSKLSDFERDGVEVTLARLYVTTRELILNVQVQNSADAEAVRDALVALLKAQPDVAFVGAPGKVQAIE